MYYLIIGFCITIVQGQLQHIFAEYLINFEDSISKIYIFQNIPKRSPFSSTIICSLTTVLFESLRVSKNNIFCPEAAKVLPYEDLLY